MNKHGYYWRTDVRLECGAVLEPLQIQRWRCFEHGTFSFLPDFLARRLRYLPEAIGKVCDLICNSRKIAFPDEVTGPSADTARRWFRELCSGAHIEQWLMQRHPPGRLEMATYLPARVIKLARSLASHLQVCPNLYTRLLQSARIATE